MPGLLTEAPKQVRLPELNCYAILVPVSIFTLYLLFLIPNNEVKIT